MSEPTKLYRYYDSAGALLYIGISKNAIQRLSEHEADKRWQTDISSIRIETFSDRIAAHDAERRAIASENPAHNLVRYAAPMPSQRRERPRRFKPSRESINSRCLHVLTSMYEETHWTDFIDKYGRAGGQLITLVFKRNERVESLSDDWMRYGRYAFECGGSRVTCSIAKYSDEIEIDLAHQRCTEAEIEEYDLSKHDALHEALCVGVTLDESRKSSRFEQVST
jgi:predicted GIY-YIG superfamily endonuclease